MLISSFNVIKLLMIEVEGSKWGVWKTGKKFKDFR